MKESTIELPQLNEAHQPLLKQHDVSRSVMKLVFNHLNSPSGWRNEWICCIDGFKSNYAIWIDNTNGNVIVSDLDNKKTNHKSVQDAMEWCQNDFELKVNGLFEDSRFRMWKEKGDIHIDGKYSNETLFEIWSAMDECDK